MPGINAGTIYSEVRIALDKLRGDVAGVKASFDKMASSSQAPAKKVEENWKKSFKGISLAGTAAIAAITIAFKSAVTTFAKTEQSLANVRAVTGATAEEFELLKNAAEEAGKTTRFRASEAADALYFLASAGFDATQSVEALDGVLLLAGATGSDLAQSAQAVTATLSQFNLEAANSEDVVNTFAAAISNSQATLEKVQGALRQVGPTAGGMNKTLEETVGVLQLLFNAGFQGENAGRALKSALADLGNESSLAVKKLKDLGISYNRINPLTNNLADVFGVLNEAGVDVTQSLEIFGKVAGNQVATLIKGGREEIEKYTEAVTGTNSAAEQYAIQNDTLSGSFDKFMSAVEGASNSLIETLAPTFRMILDALAVVLNAFTELPAALKGLVGGFGTAALAIGTVTKALSLLGITAGAALGPITLIVSALVGIGIAYSEATKNQREFRNNLKDLQTAVTNLKTESFDLIKEYQALSEKTDKTSDEMDRQEEIARKLYELYPDLTEEVLNNADAMNELAIKEAEAGKAAASLALQEVKGDLIEMQEELDKTAASIQDNLIQALVNQTETMGLTNTQIAAQNKRLEETKETIRGFKTLKEFEDFAREVGIDINSMALGFVNLDGQINDTQEAVDFFQNQIDEFTITIDENTEAIKRNNDAGDDGKDGFAEQIAARKAAEKELAEETLRIQKERSLGLISEEDAIKRIISANEKLVRSLLDIDYTGLTNELGDQAIRRALELIEELKDANAAGNKEVKEEEAQTTQDIIDIYNNRAQQIGAIREYQLSEQRKFREIEKEEEKKHAAELLAIRQQLISGSINLAQTLVSELNRGYQVDKDNEIKAIQEKVDKKVLTEEVGEKRIAQLNYEKDIADWENQNLAIIGNTAQAISVALASAPFPLNLIPIGFAAAQGAIQLGTQTKTKPKVPNLQTGGIVLPSSGSGTAAILAENGSPEAAFNLGASGEPFINLLADKVAERIGGGIIQNTLNINGETIAEAVAPYFNDGIVKVDI